MSVSIVALCIFATGHLRRDVADDKLWIHTAEGVSECVPYDGLIKNLRRDSLQRSAHR